MPTETIRRGALFLPAAKESSGTGVTHEIAVENRLGLAVCLCREALPQGDLGLLCSGCRLCPHISLHRGPLRQRQTETESLP